MKQYGANKATEFTKKQISVIYGMTKRKELKVSRFVISDLYNLAEYYGYDDSKSVENAERKILDILDSVFAKDIKAAQEKIDSYEEYLKSVTSQKYLKNADFSEI